MTVEPDKKIMKLAREIIEGAGLPYTAEQLAEIPAILAAKSRYFWCIDNQEFDMMADVFTAEGFRTFWGGRPGNKDRFAQVEQNRKTCGFDMVPMHFGYNQIVRFTGERSAQLLTKMHDYHTYKDNGDTYSGFGLYVDDLVKCDDERWRIKTLRLTYRLLDGKLRD
ncbi:MAG: nuclear transport factor 2 family protein [Oscillospiraceae bacterium]|nr:nuclear transport factor 2 family protein [Oscillospiraceae bacterium]